jgi:hypothetical protein
VKEEGNAGSFLVCFSSCHKEMAGGDKEGVKEGNKGWKEGRK